MKTITAKQPVLATPSIESTKKVIVSVSIKIIETIKTWHYRAEQRRQLMEMNDRLLADIGMSRTDAFYEAKKSFWKN